MKEKLTLLISFFLLTVLLLAFMPAPAAARFEPDAACNDNNFWHRWAYFEWRISDLPVPWAFDSNFPNYAPFRSAVTTAFGTWEAADADRPDDFDFFVGPVALGSEKILVKWGPILENPSFLGVTERIDWTGWNFEYVEITIDSDRPWVTWTWSAWGDPCIDNPRLSQPDMEAVATHEVGHALGLGAATDYYIEEMTMYGSYLGIRQRTLADGDIGGYNELYHPGLPGDCGCFPF